MKRKIDGPKLNMAADNQEETCETPLSSKLLRLDEGFGEQHGCPESYFVMINFKILKDLVENFGKCLDCGSKVETVDVLENRMGLAQKILVKCTICSWELSQ